MFDAPWQAQAFAMTLTLQQRGIFTWAEWAEMLGAARARAAAPGAPDTSESYYQDWLATLERMVTAKRLADEAALKRTRDAWDRAAERTRTAHRSNCARGIFLRIVSDQGSGAGWTGGCQRVSKAVWKVKEGLLFWKKEAKNFCSLRAFARQVPKPPAKAFFASWSAR